MDSYHMVTGGQTVYYLQMAVNNGFQGNARFKNFSNFVEVKIQNFDYIRQESQSLTPFNQDQHF